jgi:hypothetical protein
MGIKNAEFFFHNDFKFVEVVLNKCSISAHLYVNFKIFCYNIFLATFVAPLCTKYSHIVSLQKAATPEDGKQEKRPFFSSYSILFCNKNLTDL